MLTLATWITISRIVLVLPICALILTGHDLPAAALMGVAALTDFLDGYVARRMNDVSSIGTALDPIADKILIACTLLAFAAAGRLTQGLFWPALLILFREILVSGLREAASGHISLPVTGLAKIKTTVQFIAVLIMLIFTPFWGAIALWAAAALTLWTGGEYVRHWALSMRE